MRLLLDTSMVLWAMADDERLTEAARLVIDRAAEVYVSSVSIWEIAIKSSLGKLEADIGELVALLPEAGLRELPVTWEHSLAVASLPNHHRDPFDRMLVAQAKSEPMHLMTSDKTLGRYSDLVMVV